MLQFREPQVTALLQSLASG